MEKSPDAFRTISEVADWLGVPTHVLRFWESRFPQVKPVKRAGGRRYYRPADMLLLGGIKQLLHDDGLTIRGVQKMLREEGVRHVSSFSQPLDTIAPMRDVTPEDEEVAPGPMAVDVEPEPLDNIVPMATAPSAAPEQVDEAALAPAPADDRLVLGSRAEPEDEDAPADEALSPAAEDRPDDMAAAEDAPLPEEEAPQPTAESLVPPALSEPAEPEPAAEDEKLPEFSFLRRPAPEPAPAAEPEPELEAPQPDLFASRRAAGAVSEPQRPRIPATPDVPETDAPDDDASTPALPGLAARLIAHRIRPDHAAIARAVADLHALRARL